MEDKSTEVMNSVQRRPRQESKAEIRVRMSNSIDSGIRGNNLWKWSQLMKEYKSIQVMNNQKTLFRPESKSGSPQRISRTEVICIP
jgi:hypothetical protein